MQLIVSRPISSTTNMTDQHHTSNDFELALRQSLGLSAQQQQQLNQHQQLQQQLHVQQRTAAAAGAAAWGATTSTATADAHKQTATATSTKKKTSHQSPQDDGANANSNDPAEDAEEGSAAGGTGGQQAMVFPVKLHRMLTQIDGKAEAGGANNGEDEASVVSWQPHGRCFLVHDKDAFVQRFLPRYVFAAVERALVLVSWLLAFVEFVCVLCKQTNFFLPPALLHF